MRKLKFLFSLLMLMCFSVGTWAADELKATFVFTDSGWGIPTSGTNTASADFTRDGYTITLAASTNYKQNSGYLILGKANSTLTLPAFTWKTTKIEVDGHSGASGSVVQNIYVGSTAVSTATTGANGVTNTYLINSSYQAAGNVYVFTVTSAHNTQIDAIRIYGESSSTDPTISVTPNPLAFGKVLKDTYSEYYGYEAIKEIHLTGSNLTGDVSLAASDGFQIAYPYNPTSAGYKTSLTIKPQAGAIDTTIVMAYYSGSTGDKSGTLAISSEASDFETINVPITLTLVAKPAYIDGSVVDKLGISDFGITGSYTAFTDKQASNTGHSAAVYAGTVARNGSETQYNIQLNSGQTNSKLREIASTTSGGTLKRVLVIWATQTANTEGRKLYIYGSNDAYTGSETEVTGTKIGELTYAAGEIFAYLDVAEDYKYVQIVASGAIYSDEIQISWMPKEIDDPAISGQTPFYPSTTVSMSIVTDGADIVYTLNGEDPIGGDNTYTAPFTLTETTTVKARGYKGVKLGDIVTKEFVKATPKTVAEAIALIPSAGNTENDQFVVGYVCTAGTSVSSGQMTYYISANGATVDEGTATTDRLQVYKGKNLNNTDFSAVGDLVVGDKVVVYGQLKNYNGTYEFNSGNYIVERVAKGDVASVAISGTATHGAYEGGDAFDPAGLTVTATYASGYQEDVTASATWSPATITTQSGNTDVTASFGGKTSAAKTVNISLNKYTVTFNTSVYGGTWGIQKAGEPISSGNYFPKGTVLTVVTNPVAGYALGSITVNDEPLVGNEITIGTENISVAVEFTMVQEGVLVLSTKSLDWGTITAGTSPLSVPFKTFTLAGSNLTESRTVTLTTPDWCHLTQTTANPTAGGNIATTSFYVYVNDATLNAAGEYSGNIVISSDDLTADSLIAVSLNVVEATPSISVKDVYAQDITSIDFGNVDKGASVSQFNISLVGHNLTGDVKVTVANATSTNVFVTNGFRPSNTYYQNDGEIDAAVIVIPFTSTGGEFNGTITFHSESGDFDDIVIPLHINIKPDAGLEWSAATATAYTKAKPYELPTLTNPHDVTVAYSSSDETVAKFDGSGNLDVLKDGETVITASFAGNGDYVAQEVDYTLTVKAPTGLRLSGEMTTKEYEEGDHVSVDGYTVEAVFGSPYDYYDVTSEATWKLDGVDIATKTVTSTSEYTIEATWEGFTAWEYVNLVRKTHAVNFNDPEHGTLTVTVFGGTFISGAKFKKGTEVIISINPAVGYEGAVTVNGEPLVGNSYTIGTEDITIVATFNEVTIPKHKVTFTNGINGTFQVKKDGEAISSGNQYAEGTEFTIWTNPAKDYKVGAITINGEPIEGTSFVMGSEDIEVGVSFVLKPEPNLGWSSTSDVYAYTDNGKSYTMPTLVNPDNLDITFTTTTSVATVNADGTINLIGSGFTLVQINFAGNDTYRSAYPHFRLWVCAPKSLYISEVSTHKSSYNYGEAFDFTGLKATLVYDNNGGDRDVTSEAEWTSDPATVTMDGDYTITAAYGDIQGTKSLYASVKAYPSIDANRTSIDFGEVIKGSASWPSQELTITGANLTAAVDATALATGGGAVFYIEDKSYVRLTPVEGSINATVSISANPNLPVGEYNGSVKIESIAATADFEPIYVDLHMTIVSNATALDNVETEEPASKILLNNQLFIIRDGKMFDASGALVK